MKNIRTLSLGSMTVALVVLGCHPPRATVTRSSERQVVEEARISVERFFIDSRHLEDNSLPIVIRYASHDGVIGRVNGDTVTYDIPKNGLLQSRRPEPGPATRSRVYRVSGAGDTSEVRIAGNCIVLRGVTLVDPKTVYGCWFPRDLLPPPPTAFVGIVVGDSATLGTTFNRTSQLINELVYRGSLSSIPRWTEEKKQLPR